LIKPVGVVVLGKNSLAVDATCCRLMGFDPLRVPYLHAAATLFSGIRESEVYHRGENPRKFATPFTCLPQHEAYR
ncbi:MAG TPA: DUF362 domain-containing protein, partial [Candidatus Ozemobacteraceae bacterium]|nr:DUF362 domain-containing protein [Candidatus Ozemobacteraceae bacterium]